LDTLRAIFLMVLAMALLAASDAFLKLASQHAPVGQVMLMLSLGGTAVFVLMARARRVRLPLSDLRNRLVLLRCAFEMVGAVGMLVGLSKVPLSVMAAIMQTAPLVVVLGAALFLKEPVGWRRWAAVLTGMVGMLMVIRPFGATFTGWELFAVMGVTGLAARDLVTRLLPPHMHPISISTWGFAAVIPVGLALMLLTGAAPVLNLQVAVFMLGAIVVTTAGYLAVTAAMRMAPVSAVSPFRYARLIFTAGLGMAIFGDRPDGWTWAGAALILGAGLYSFLRERRLARAAMAAAG
jgi:drug/metabolite transporter (DMT)-like permease